MWIREFIVKCDKFINFRFTKITRYYKGAGQFFYYHMIFNQPKFSSSDIVNISGNVKFKSYIFETFLMFQKHFLPISSLFSNRLKVKRSFAIHTI